MISIVQHSYAWNSRGHEIVAEIALLQLKRSEIMLLQQLNQAYPGKPIRSLAKTAAWLDWVSRDAVLRFTKPYHYIDLPFAIDNVTVKPPLQDNAMTALQHAQTVLINPHADPESKALQLRIILHVVADIHQPLHAITRYTKTFPTGDRGGNDFKLGKNRVADNLHAYWDRGGGSLMKQGHRHRPIHFKKRAQTILKQYPCQQFSLDFNPTAWSKESYEIARKVAYQIREYEKPSVAYQKQVKAMTTLRLAMAGCRLGKMLKNVNMAVA